MSFSEGLLLSAKKSKLVFERLTSEISYEYKGILFSEMFFLSLCLENIPFNRILESGRARGQSTYMLSKIFPDRQIISIEFDPNSPDVDIARQKLKDCSNVQLDFGDAIDTFPRISQSGDVVLIDGPKGYRSLRFALKLLATKKIPMVFIHDTTKGTPVRQFLEKYLKQVIFSDDLKIASITSSLDLGKVKLPSELQLEGRKGYGFSLACIPYDSNINYRLILLKSIISGIAFRWFKRRISRAHSAA